MGAARLGSRGGRRAAADFAIPEHSFILLVEDDDESREGMQSLLEEVGLSVRAVANGEEALALLERSDSFPSVLVTDLDMPRMGGRQLIHELEQARALAHTKVAVVTGSPTEVAPDRAAIIFRKPFRSVVFANSVVALARRR